MPNLIPLERLEQILRAIPGSGELPIDIQTNSITIGHDGPKGATELSTWNVIGNYSIDNANSIKNSNIFGLSTCRNVISMTDSNVVGSFCIMGSGSAGSGVYYSCLFGNYVFAMSNGSSVNATVAIGMNVGYHANSAGRSVLIGCNALNKASTAANIVAIGTDALMSSNTGHYYDVVIGDSVLSNTTATVKNATVIGYHAGMNVQTADGAVIIGSEAGMGGEEYSETSNYGTATIIGRQAAMNSPSASNAVVVGYNAANVPISLSGVIIGTHAASSSSEYLGSVAILGNEAGKNATYIGSSTLIGSQVAMGAQKLSYSTIIGHNAAGIKGDSTTEYEVNESTIIGSNACCPTNRNPNITRSTVIGHYAGSGRTSIAGILPKLTYATIIGDSAGNSGETAIVDRSLLLGTNAGLPNIDGVPTEINRSTLVGGLDAGSYSRVAPTLPNVNGFSGCTFIGNATGSTLSPVLNSTAIGFNALVTGSNQVQLGNASTTTYVYGTVQNRSDERDKADITPLTYDYKYFIRNLKPVNFKWDMREDYMADHAEDETPPGHSTVERDGSHKRIRAHNGFVAQDVKKLMDEMDFDFAGYQDISHNGGEEILTLGYDEILAPLVATVQELMLKVDQLSQGSGDLLVGATVDDNTGEHQDSGDEESGANITHMTTVYNQHKIGFGKLTFNESTVVGFETLYNVTLPIQVHVLRWKNGQRDQLQHVGELTADKQFVPDEHTGWSVSEDFRYWNMSPTEEDGIENPDEEIPNKWDVGTSS